MDKLFNYLNKVYTEEESKYILETIKPLLTHTPKKDKDKWYKTMNMYVTYPDSFKSTNGNGLSLPESKATYLRNLGINAIHILPLFESPGIDAGFDVSDYMKVRADLGGNEAFEKVLEVCKKKDIKVFVDFVLNHISNKHKWFLKGTTRRSILQRLLHLPKRKAYPTKKV